MQYLQIMEGRKIGKEGKEGKMGDMFEKVKFREIVGVGSEENRGKCVTYRKRDLCNGWKIY